jgi:GT2 family glycosyltransferase
MTQAVKISVIIPNLHSPIVDKTIESVLAQKTDQPFEVIVVGMDKWGLVERYPEIQFIKTPKPVGAAEARNIGIRAAQGEWFLFIDSDCIANEGWIEHLTNAFNEGWFVIGGGIKTPEEPFFLLVYNLSMFHAQLSSQDRKPVKYLPTLNLAVKRDVIESVGLLDEVLLRGQDVDWTARMLLAGYDLLFEPNAKILHLPARYDLETLRNYFHKSGFYMIRVRHRYPDIFKMPGIFKKGIVFLIFAPLIAFLTTMKIYIKTKEVRKHSKTIPFIYLLKLSWCQGAAESLKTVGNGLHE